MYHLSWTYIPYTDFRTATDAECSSEWISGVVFGRVHVEYKNYVSFEVFRFVLQFYGYLRHSRVFVGEGAPNVPPCPDCSTGWIQAQMKSEVIDSSLGR